MGWEVPGELQLTTKRTEGPSDGEKHRPDGITHTSEPGQACSHRLAQASFNGAPFPYTQSPSYHHMQSGELHLQWQHFRIRQPGCLFGDNKSLQRETLLSYWQTQFCEPSHFILEVWAVAPNPTLTRKD